MPSVNESSKAAKSQLASGLDAAVDTVARPKIITFTKYVRFVLPLDGFVFWVNAKLIPNITKIFDPSLESNANQKQPRYISGEKEVKIKGSFHYATETIQAEDETFDKNTIIFTSETDVDPFNEVGARVMYIGKFEGVRFAFSQRKPFSLEGRLYHYRGFAIYPAMESQIIDRSEDLDLNNAVVSNSLPIWLSLNKLMPIFPAFLSTANLPPPYATIEIDENSMRALQLVPYIDRDSNQWQLVSEDVKVTIYGQRSNDVHDFLKYINDYTMRDDAAFGVMNAPIPIDKKRTQSELRVIAMKKQITFKINYYQTRARNIARQLIIEAVIKINES